MATISSSDDTPATGTPNPETFPGASGTTGQARARPSRGPPATHVFGKRHLSSVGLTTMARSDLLKDMFASYGRGDHAAFHAAAQDVIRDERRKRHDLLADELQRLLSTAAQPTPLNVSTRDGCCGPG